MKDFTESEFTVDEIHVIPRRNDEESGCRMIDYWLGEQILRCRSE
jgi:hypothetical protein